MQKREFYCQTCKKIFKAKGKLEKWINPVYGPCKKLIAKCPKCKDVADEYKPVRKIKGGNSSSASSAPACATGACPYMN